MCGGGRGAAAAAARRQRGFFGFGAEGVWIGGERGRTSGAGRLGMEEPFLSAPGFLFVPSCVSNSARGCHKEPGFARKAPGFSFFRFSLISLLCRGWRGGCVWASLGSPER